MKVTGLWSLLLLLSSCLALRADIHYVNGVAGLDVSARGGTNSTTDSWATIDYAIRQEELGAGDTLQIVGGTYVQKKGIGGFENNGSSGSPITIEPKPGTGEVIITYMRDDEDTGFGTWITVDEENDIYKIKIPTPFNDTSEPDLTKRAKDQIKRVIHCSRLDPNEYTSYGVPMRLMTDDDVQSTNDALLTGENQWIRGKDVNDDWYAYVRLQASETPAQAILKFAIQSVGGGPRNTISILKTEKFITLKNLTIVGGFYPVLIDGDDVVVDGCKIRNCYQDGIKT